MKKLVFVVLTALMLVPSTKVLSQGRFGADSAECLKYLSYYSEYYKQKNYTDALPNWRKAFALCPPTASQNLLLNGQHMMRQLIAKNAANPEYRKALIDTLFTLYDLREQYYPKTAVGALNNKGLEMANYIKDDEALYAGYNDIIEKNKAQTKPSIFIFDFNAALALKEAGKLDAEQVINTYQRNLDLLDQAQPKTEVDKEQVEKARKDLQSLFMTSKVASVDELVALFTPRFNENPNDEALVTNIVKMLGNTEGGDETDLFFQAVTAMHKISPSHSSAYYLFRLNASKGYVDEAIRYIEHAISDPESDSATDADYAYAEAVFCSKNGRPGKAVQAANQARELDPGKAGECYMIMGTVWASLNCGGDEVSSRAKFWVATDYMQKAKAADESLAEAANNNIRQYSRYYPQTAEAFMYDLVDGKSYSISCGGMSATTTVRTVK